MKQILQNLRSGETAVTEVPSPGCGSGLVKIKTACSLVSAGTERMLVEFSQSNLLQKARSQPDKVRQVLAKISADGLMPTLEAVFKRLDEPLPLGYCNAGTVIETGPGVTDLKPGDRVANNGPHAEYVCVPRNLCAKIPDSVTDEEAAFTVLGAIALQGVRLTLPTMGEKFAVFGAGLIGLVTIQLLHASGCQVLAIDPNPERLKLAAGFGAATCNPAVADTVVTAEAWTEAAGVDAVLITASAKSDEIVHQAAEMCRKRGRVVLVGVVGLNLRRSDFYEKELTFQVSCSYGPGRYDEQYEQQGHDYPPGYVRWTEQRNFQAVLRAMASGRLNVGSLITDRIRLADAHKAYDKIAHEAGALGVILEHSGATGISPTITINRPPSAPAQGCIAAMLGAGNFAKMTMAPALAATTARLKYVADPYNPPAAAHIAHKYRFENATSDSDAVWADPEVNTVFIATGHSSHAALVKAALQAGKHVFVEKPLAMTEAQLNEITAAAEAAPGTQIMVGFNRRFSPYTTRIKELLTGRAEPLAMHFSCNAGFIPADSWVHDPERGGGRIIGEACHFIDLLSFIADSHVVSVAAVRMGRGTAVQDDKMAIVMEFADGSLGTINYFANGHKAYPKETLEIYSERRIIRLDNFRRLQAWGFRKFRSMKGRIDKGHKAEFKAFVELVNNGGPALIPLPQLSNTTRAGFAAVKAARDRSVVILAAEPADSRAARET